ncbi:MAG: YicC/YloC family endoribonuclease [Hyphomicrobiaceae bacterium]
MPLQSMTGFARIDGGDADCAWYWEIRTVNGKGLDVRARLANGLDSLEPQVREIIGKHLKRGNCSVNLFIQRESGGLGVQLNEAILADVLKAADRAAEISGMDRPTLESLLNVRGVLEVNEGQESDAVQDQRKAAMLVDLEKAVQTVSAARGEEGARMHALLNTLIDQIEGLVGGLTTAPGRDLTAVREKFQTKLDRMLEDSTSMDPQRLHQEVVLLATKADIEEELGRLTSHVAAARDLIARDEPVGRQLEFLSQEFNREANTVCSKSNDEAVTQIGMELKTVIDQFREQVQNIE